MSRLLVAQCLARFQHVLDAFERLWFTAQRDKRLALQIKKVLLVDPLARRELPAAKNVSDFARDVQIVLAHIATLLHDVEARAQRGERVASCGIAPLTAHWRGVAGGGEFEYQPLRLRYLMIAIHHDLVGTGKKPERTRFGGA